MCVLQGDEAEQDSLAGSSPTQEASPEASSAASQEETDETQEAQVLLVCCCCGVFARLPLFCALPGNVHGCIIMRKYRKGLTVQCFSTYVIAHVLIQCA